MGPCGRLGHIYGDFHSLPFELQGSIIAVPKKLSMILKKLNDEALTAQKLPGSEKRKLHIKRKFISHERVILQQ
jgi:hypothetical protein